MKLNDRIRSILIFIFLFLMMLIFPYIPLLLLGISIDSLSETVKIWYNFGCDILLIIITFFIFRKDMIRDIKSYFKNFLDNFELSFKYYIVGFGIMIVSNLLIATYITGANANNEETIRKLINLYPIYMFFSVALYAPFIEETIFRKCIKNIVVDNRKNNITKYLYIFISGFVFAIMHIIGVAEGALDYVYIVPYLALGSAFAALYYKTDNLFHSIVIHAMHNTVAIILYIALGIV